METATMQDGIRRLGEDTDPPESPPTRRGGISAGDPDEVDLSTMSLAERLETLVQWQRAVIAQMLKLQGHVDKVTLAVHDEGEARRAAEGAISEQIGHMAHALSTLATAISETRRKLDEKTRHDSHQDLDLAELTEKTGQQQAVIDRVQQQQAELKIAKLQGVRAGGGAALGLAAVVELLRLLNAHWPW
jgi:hypothetical protein